MMAGKMMELEKKLMVSEEKLRIEIKQKEGWREALSEQKMELNATKVESSPP